MRSPVHEGGGLDDLERKGSEHSIHCSVGTLMWFGGHQSRRLRYIIRIWHIKGVSDTRRLRFLKIPVSPWKGTYISCTYIYIYIPIYSLVDLAFLPRVFCVLRFVLGPRDFSSCEPESPLRSLYDVRATSWIRQYPQHTSATCKMELHKTNQIYPEVEQTTVTADQLIRIIIGRNMLLGSKKH